MAATDLLPFEERAPIEHGLGRMTDRFAERARDLVNEFAGDVARAHPDAAFLAGIALPGTRPAWSGPRPAWAQSGGADFHCLADVLSVLAAEVVAEAGGAEDLCGIMERIVKGVREMGVAGVPRDEALDRLEAMNECLARLSREPVERYADMEDA